jgi:CheY-like chemotaxis protein
VLAVDDEEPIRVVAEQVLRRQGFDVVVAVDGVQAGAAVVPVAPGGLRRGDR